MKTDLKKLNRIWIFGGTNSGKSTLAKQLSKKLKLKHYNTDFMKYNKDFTKKLPDGTKERKIKDLAQKIRWICEGTNNGKWVWPAFKKADFVIILNLNPFTRMRRLLTREVKERRRKLSFNKRIYLLYVVFSYSFNGYRHHKKLIRLFNKDFIVLRNQKEINRFLESIK